MDLSQGSDPESCSALSGSSQHEKDVSQGDEGRLTPTSGPVHFHSVATICWSFSSHHLYQAAEESQYNQTLTVENQTWMGNIHCIYNLNLFLNMFLDLNSHLDIGQEAYLNG